MQREDIVARLGALALFVAPALTLSAAQLDSAAAAKGQLTYARYCVSCHGEAGKGDGPIAGDLRVAVPDLTTLAERSGGAFPYDHVVSLVTDGGTVRGHGTKDMPAWGDVFKKTAGTGEKSATTAIRNLAHYLWSLQRQSKSK